MNEKNSVLIIEDSRAISILIRDFLKELGYMDIVTCDTGKMGIQTFSDLINAGKVPVVLLDFQLPDMDANEIMTSIFNIRPDAKVILETADAHTDEQIKTALRGGAYQYIQKPIRYEHLKNIFDTLESEKQLLEKNNGINNSENVMLCLQSLSRTSLARLCEYSKTDMDEVKQYLSNLEREKKIMKINNINEVACNRCNSVNVLPIFYCPSCNGTNFKQGKLIEHFKCGNISIDESYKENICPKCKKEIKILGVDYKVINDYYICSDCKDKFPYLSQDYVCVKCDNRFALNKAKWISSEGYQIINCDLQQH